MHNSDREHDAWNAFSKRLASARLAKNIPCDSIVLDIEGQQLPVTLNLEGRADTSWVASLRNAYGPYAREESSRLLKGWLARYGGELSAWLGESILMAAGLSGGLYLNNWIVSTNLHQIEFNARIILQAKERLRNKYPGVPLVIRSLMIEHHRELITELVDAGFVLLPTRQVWLMDTLSNGRYRKRTDVKNDLKLEHHSDAPHQWTTSDTFSEEDWLRVLRLYRWLYLEKYPDFNPDYDLAFILEGVDTGWLDVQGLRHPSGHLDGVLGTIRRPGWMSCPLFGYALDAPITQGLYRRLTTKAFEIGEREGRIMHCSGGAGRFKQTRGAYQTIEYAACFLADRSTSRLQTLLLKATSAALHKWAIPYLKKHSL